MRCIDYACVCLLNGSSLAVVLDGAYVFLLRLRLVSSHLEFTLHLGVQEFNQ